MKKSVTFSALAIFGVASAQNKISLEESEDAFRHSSLQLLSQQYNISQADADIIQAKIWDQPTLNYGASVHTPQNNRWFDVPHTSTVGLQQLFLLGGKRRKQVDILNSTKEIQQYQYAQTASDLLTQLRENYFSLYFEEEKIKKIDLESEYLKDLWKAYKDQKKLGNISLKDVVSIQNMLTGLYATKQSLNNNVQNYRQNLKVLTSIESEITPEISETTVRKYLERTPDLTLDEIKQKAVENNAGYLAAQKQITNSQYNLSYQKSLNIPDITAGVNFSQMGNYSFNESDFSVSIPLPLWSKNKGNIKHAEYSLEQSKVNADLQKITLVSQVEQNYNTWKAQYEQYNAFKEEDYKNADLIYDGMKKNFRLGNVALTDFTIFMDAYNQNMLQLLELKKQILISAEEVNHLTQSKIFNP